MSAGGGAPKSVTGYSLVLGESASLYQLCVNEYGFAYSVNGCYPTKTSWIYFNWIYFKVKLVPYKARSAFTLPCK